MKLLRVENDHYIFHLAKRESDLLALILRLYPVIPSAHQQLSKSPNASDKANQRLLDEAMAEQRNENKKLVEALLTDSKRFHAAGASSEMTLRAAEIEWLLQVLNDVRVGNWILLGSPDDGLSEMMPNDQNAPHLWAMELAGFFQMNLLQAVSRDR